MTAVDSHLEPLVRTVEVGDWYWCRDVLIHVTSVTRTGRWTRLHCRGKGNVVFRRKQRLPMPAGTRRIILPEEAAPDG